MGGWASCPLREAYKMPSLLSASLNGGDFSTAPFVPPVGYMSSFITPIVRSSANFLTGNSGLGLLLIVRSLLWPRPEPALLDPMSRSMVPRSIWRDARIPHQAGRMPALLWFANSGMRPLDAIRGSLLCKSGLFR